MIVLREMASAKINLYLHVTGKRNDGYHLLDSLVGFAEYADKLEVIPSEQLTLSVDGPYARQISTQDNSVLKAAEALRDYAKITVGAALTLYKQLPVAAGIGGGSADAAAALRLLVRFWNIKISGAALHAIALKLGADVPACLFSQSLYMGGIGEQIDPGPSLEGLHVVLVNPGKPLATATVFAAFDGMFSTPARHPGAFATPAACAEFLGKLNNDLEIPALARMPQITLVLESIARQKGCMFARMSGSGATCFGLFDNAQLAQQAELTLATEHAAWWVKSSALK